MKFRSQLSRLVQNSALLFMLNLMVRLSNAFLFWLLAKQNTAQAGVFNLAFSYTLVVEAISLWGLDQLLIRDVAHDRAQAAHLFPRYMALRFLLSIVGLAVCSGLIALTSGYTPSLTVIIVLLMITVLTEGFNDVCLALFVALDWLRLPVLLGIGVALLRLLLAGGLVWMQQPLLLVVLSLVGLSGLLALANVVLLRIRRIASWPIFNRELIQRLFVVAAPLGLINVLWALDAQSGNLLMSFRLTDAPTVIAHNGVITTILSGLQLLPAAMQMSLFPPLTRMFHRDRSAFWQRYEQLQRAMAFAGVGVALGLIVLAPALVRLLFAPEYQAAVGPLQIMGGAMVLYFVTIPDSRAMIITNQLWRLVGMLLLSLMVNWTLLLVLLPAFNLYAVVIARVVALAVFFLLNHAVVSFTLHHFSLWRIALQPGLAGLAGLAFWHLTRAWPLINYSLPVVVYAVVAGGLLLLNPRDRHWLQQALRRGRPANSLEHL